MEEIYKEPSYFHEIYGDYFSSKAGYRNVLAWFERVSKYLTDKEAAIVEIGSGSGCFLEVLRNLGYKNFRGYELNELAIRECRSKGLPVHHQVEFKDEQEVDAVFMFDVIEHLPDGKGFLRGIHAQMKQGGLVIIETSCNRRYVSRLLGKMWWFLIPPNHVVIYNIKSLAELLCEVGFEIVDSTNINFHWISIKNALTKVNNRFPGMCGRRALISSDINFPFYHFTSFQTVGRRRL